MFFNQGTRQPEASQEKVNGDMASVWEELDDVQLATVVGGLGTIQGDGGGQVPLVVEYTWVVEVGGEGTSWVVRGGGPLGSGEIGGTTKTL
jgi:hypothetical protein